MLSDSFNEVICRAGIPNINHPIFYNSPIGIRFEIGGDEPVYINDSSDSEEVMNPKYVSEALKRAKALYLDFPHQPDILRIDTYPDEERDQQEGTLKKLFDLGLSRPQEQKLIYVQWEDYGDTVKQLQSYWKIAEPFRPEILLQEIIKADIGGISGLVSNVYFVNSVDSVLFHLYDDRGADLVASDKELLRPIFEKFNDWIMDYDREQIKRTFAK
jgi:hypothetical protein